MALYRPITLLSVCDKPDFAQYVYSWSRLEILSLGRSSLSTASSSWSCIQPLAIHVCMVLYVPITHYFGLPAVLHHPFNYHLY